jgi:RNA polymerase sigma-70 factor (ECF subfamily)
MLVNQSGVVFAELVREHQAMVFSIALRFLRDRTVAEELAQDVFLRLYRELPRLESRDHVKFWLRKVVVTRAMDYARSARRRREVALAEVPEPTFTARGRDPLLEASVRKLVASLPNEARMVIVLRYQEEMEPHEIAELLGLPLATVKSRLRRSLGLLRGKAQRLMGVPMR